MALKVVFVLFLAILLFTECHGDPFCIKHCTNVCHGNPSCFTKCSIVCEMDVGYSLGHFENHVCNAGCSLGHCYKFLIEYDKNKFGSCMTSCNENYCISNTPLKKA